jgi:hypothetical protein
MTAPAAWGDTEGDLVRTRLVEMAARLPETDVVDGYGHTGFLVRGKRFAWLLADHHGDGRLALTVKAPRGELEALMTQDAERYFAPAYLAVHGWVGIDLGIQLREGEVDWNELTSMLDQGYRLSASRRQLAALDNLSS